MAKGSNLFNLHHGETAVSSPSRSWKPATEKRVIRFASNGFPNRRLPVRDASLALIRTPTLSGKNRRVGWFQDKGLHDRCRRQTIPGNPPQRAYMKDQPSWPISVSNCIYETYDLGETLILGGGFRTLQGRLLFPTDAQRFSRPLHYVLLVYVYLRVEILERIVSKSLTLKVLNIWRRGRDSNPR